MTRGLLLAVALMALGPVLQGAWLSHAAPGGVTVDLTLGAALALGSTFGALVGACAGLLGGFIMDAACGAHGVLVAAYALAALTAGLLADVGRGDDLVGGLACGVLAATVCALATAVGLWVSGGRCAVDLSHVGLWVGYEAALTVLLRRLLGRPRVPFLAQDLTGVGA